jgi:hypothetical protein
MCLLAVTAFWVRIQTSLKNKHRKPKQEKLSTTSSPLKSVKNIFVYVPLKLIGHNKLVGTNLLL